MAESGKDVDSMFAEDAVGESSGVDFDEAKLKAVTILANRQIDLEDDVARLTNDLAEQQKKLKQVSEVDLPTAMKEIGLKDFSLATGEKIEIKHGLAASITKAHEVEAFSWLMKNRAGSLIKNQVVVSFGMKQDAMARKFLRDMARRKVRLEYQQKKSVHPQSLAAFCRTQIEEGKEIPMDLLGVYEYDRAKVTRPKTK